MVGVRSFHVQGLTKEALQLDSPPGEPVMVYTGEERMWLPTLTNG